jgi:HAMP domain-containing protein
MSSTGSLALDTQLTHGHAHIVTTIVLIVIAIVAAIALGVWRTRGPSAEELRRQRAA